MNKTIRLSNLHLRNFKGIKEFSLVTDGKNVQVFGDNATGKTTLFDAFSWLLFGKDSQNKKDFSIKTIDGNGKELHKLEHEVSATLLIDGTPLTLKKIYHEVWTKKRGSAKETFTRHTVDHFINDVPAQAKEYQDKIAETIDEDVFKLITNPAYFNELKWQDRRKVLLEIAGDVTDEGVISSNPSSSKLKDALSKYNSEEIKKMIAGKRKKINSELKNIPVRIDEIHRNLPDTTGQDKTLLEQQINDITAQIDEQQDLISNIRNGNAIAQKQREIQEVEIELLKIKQHHKAGATDDIYRVKASIQEEESNVHILKRDIKGLEYELSTNETNVQSLENRLENMRVEYISVNEKEFVYNENSECPTCGQDFPEKRMNEARERMASAFNQTKHQKLATLHNEANEKKDKIERITNENEKYKDKISKIGTEIGKKEITIEKLKKQLTELENNVTDITENRDYVAKLEEKQALTKELNDIRLSAEGSIQEVQIEILKLKKRRNEMQEELAKFASIEQSQVRIVELEEEEKRLSAEFEELEEQLYLVEEFIRTKVNMLEEKINSKFRYARFNLFKNNINGGLEEVCETTYEGVPYSSGLNNANKINVGLDIINTLSDHYGFKAPLFVDNAEAITKMIEVDTQVISLIVSEQDKQLRVALDKTDSLITVDCEVIS